MYDSRSIKQRIFNNARRLNRSKKSKFLYYYLKCFRNIEKDKVTEICKSLDVLILLLNKKFGNNWDLYPVGDALFKGFFVAIKFPKLIVENKDNLKYVYRDTFYVFKLNFEPDFLSTEDDFEFQISNEPLGFSTNHSERDLIRLKDTLNYLNDEKDEIARKKFIEKNDLQLIGHPHLRYYYLSDMNTKSRSVVKPSDYCLGNGVHPLKVAAIDFNKLEKNSFDSIEFKYYLNLIKPFLKWESIEGAPYNHISKSIDRYEQGSHKYLEYDRDSYNLSERIFVLNKERSGEYFLKLLLEKLDYSFDDNKISILDNGKFEEVVNNLINLYDSGKLQTFIENRFNTSYPNSFNDIIMILKNTYVYIIDNSLIEYTYENLNKINFSNIINYENGTGLYFSGEELKIKIKRSKEDWDMLKIKNKNNFTPAISRKFKKSFFEKLKLKLYEIHIRNN